MSIVKLYKIIVYLSFLLNISSQIYILDTEKILHSLMIFNFYKKGGRWMKIVIACGSGVATSTLIASKVDDLLKKNGLKAQVIQCSLVEVDGYLNGATLVVTAMGRLVVKGDVPVVVALPYITGIGAEVTDAAIEKILLEAKEE